MQGEIEGFSTNPSQNSAYQVSLGKVNQQEHYLIHIQYYRINMIRQLYTKKA
jgi:hypothetical protein